MSGASGSRRRARWVTAAALACLPLAGCASPTTATGPGQPPAAPLEAAAPDAPASPAPAAPAAPAATSRPPAPAPQSASPSTQARRPGAGQFQTWAPAPAARAGGPDVTQRWGSPVDDPAGYAAAAGLVCPVPGVPLAAAGDVVVVPATAARTVRAVAAGTVVLVDRYDTAAPGAPDPRGIAVGYALPDGTTVTVSRVGKVVSGLRVGDRLEAGAPVAVSATGPDTAGVGARIVLRAGGSPLPAPALIGLLCR